jgi:hypothetical protein
MSGFISTPPAPVTSQDAILVVDGWFPPINLAGIRDTLRIGENIVTDARLRAATEGAIITAMRSLSDWRSIHAAAGIDNLIDVPGNAGEMTIIGGRSVAMILWERIIRYYTAADLADDYRDISATIDGRARADGESLSADDYRRKGHNAVTDLLSFGAARVARNLVELI